MCCSFLEGEKRGRLVKIPKEVSYPVKDGGIHKLPDLDSHARPRVFTLCHLLHPLHYQMGLVCNTRVVYNFGGSHHGC